MRITQAFAIFCSALLLAQSPYTFAQQAQPAGAPAQTGAGLSAQQLDSLVAPIALYPDPILSQVLVASTYPLEIVEAGRWLAQHSNLTGQALADAVKKQTWDASVQALVAMPDVLKRLDQNVNWTSDLGNAFLSQQEGVMQAVQRLRQKAQSAGALQTTPQQTVSTTTDSGQNYIVIEPASPTVVYVPQYNPVAVWGPPPEYYPYPPIYYPPYSGAAIAASAISFGAGVAIGAIWGNNGGWGGWGWNCGWGRNNVVINNNFINNNRFNRVNVGNGNAWVHNPIHRGGVPYNNRGMANRFGGAGLTPSTRPSVAQTERRLSEMPGARGGAGNFGQGGASRLGPAGAGRSGIGQGNLGGRGGAAMPGRGAMPGQGSASRLSPANIGGNQIGNRNIGGGASQGMFGGMNQGGARTRMNDTRGFGSAGGGFRGGGFGGGGGGFRGGGRRR
jgi:hypothetical protein